MQSDVGNKRLSVDWSETDKTQAKTKNNRKNAVVQGRTQCVEVELLWMRSKNTEERSLSQIEAM
jgi:hypothetical protein